MQDRSYQEPDSSAYASMSDFVPTPKSKVAEDTSAVAGWQADTDAPIFVLEDAISKAFSQEVEQEKLRPGRRSFL